MLHEPVKALKPLPMLELPKIPGKGREQTLQEWHAAGGSVPVQYKSKPHVWHAKVKKYAEGGPVGDDTYGNAPDDSDGGAVQDAQHFQAGGIAKLLKAAKPMVKAASEILPAAEREANLAKLLEPSQVKERLYHGTTDNVNVFDPKQAGKKTGNVNAALGSFLSNRPAEANRYATQWGTTGGNVMPVYAQIKNPYEMPYKEFNDMAMGSWNRRMKDPDYDPNSVLKFNDLEGHKAAAANLHRYDEAAKLDTLNRRQELMDLGYDGVVVKIGGNKEYVAFEPNQIKSAIGNRGTYDVTDPDITKKAGGAIHMADGGAAFGKYPAMKPSTSKGKKEAQYRLPLDVARGAVAGVLGMPGDLETLGRLGVNLAFGPGGVDVSNESFLPTSEDIEKRIPFRGTEPVNELGAGFGSLIGGLSPAPAKAAIKGAKAVGHGALDLAKSEGARKVVEKVMASPMMAPSRQMNVIKEPGGNWLSGAGSPEQALADLKRPDRATGNRRDPKESMAEMKATYTPEVLATMSPETKAHVAAATHDLEKKIAMNDWVDRNLTNYVKKQMGTVDDPVRKLAEEGISHMPEDVLRVDANWIPEEVDTRRMKAGYPRAGVGQSPLAKGWETLSDQYIGSTPASKLIEPLTASEAKRGFKSVEDTNPWLRKVSPETPIHSAGLVDSPGFSWGGTMGSDLGFDHILDVLREDVAAGRIRPEQLNKVSMEQAVRRTYEYDQELAKAAETARAKTMEGMTVHKEYPEGYKWVQLDQPGQFSQESDVMGHSVRGYEPPRGHPDYIPESGGSGSSSYGHGGWEGIKSGQAKVYSLRDPKGTSHATVEVGSPQLKYGMTAGDIDPYRIRLREQFPEANDEKIYKMAVDEFTKDQTANLPSRITQIKGKSNAAPKEDYIPYIQDFVKSGNWSDVGDASNAGLRRYGNVFSEAEDKLIKAAGKKVPEHQFLTGEEIQELHNAINPEGKRLKYSPTGNIIGSDEGFFKSGGEVHMAGGGLLTAALAKLGKAGARLSAEELQAVKQAGRIAHANEASARAAKDAEVAQQMASLPARSKSANEALGLYHPVGGGVKLSKPVTGMHATTVADPKFNQPLIKTITPEQLVKEEAALFPLVGDRAAGGRYLTHVGENELEEPVRLTAGARYMDANYNPINPEESAAWESGLGRVTALGRQAERAGEGGRPVYGVYTAGSGTNTDFNVMGANALLQQLPHSKITKKAAAEFDNAMREGTKGHGPIPDWPGILSPETYDLLLDKSNGTMRTKLFDIMGKEKFQSMGFPDVPATRKAIVEPELLDVPTNQAGFRLARMDTTGRIIENPIIPSDYPSAMAGKVAGTLDRPEDYKDIWQSHFGQRRLLSQPESGDYYSFSRAHPIQYADQEWLDKIMQGREKADELSKIGKYAQGGSAKKKPSGGLASIKNKQSSRSHAAKET